jgi:hypothetical protein
MLIDEWIYQSFAPDGRIPVKDEAGRVLAGILGREIDPESAQIGNGSGMIYLPFKHRLAPSTGWPLFLAGWRLRQWAESGGESAPRAASAIDSGCSLN